MKIKKRRDRRGNRVGVRASPRGPTYREGNKKRERRRVNSFLSLNAKSLPSHLQPRECRCKKGECPIYTSRQEHSKGQRFYCCPFNRAGVVGLVAPMVEHGRDAKANVKVHRENIFHMLRCLDSVLQVQKL
ncbi:hypothetical protein QJS10_CPA08g00462 [Acorus calamus]|uniref:Zinc finger GRF-type domain-containing protein n=1 Tax=Acorus calamus TaxID=4465 RepID=A0AAV9ECM8_ACOCL|nr:hypothetical protein QJS10_CPA08g00462 [Acorus calamus]